MNCVKCIHWSLKESGQMARNGFAICLKQERYRFFPPQNTCGKFSQADQKLIDARIKFLDKGK